MIIKNGEILAIDHIAHDNTLSGNGTSAKPVGLSQSTKNLIDSKVKKTDFETYKSSAANQISNINTKITTDESNFESYKSSAHNEIANFKSSAHDEIARVDASIAAVNAAKVDKITFTQYQTDVANSFTAVNKRIDDVDAAKVDNTTFDNFKGSANGELTSIKQSITDLDNAKQNKGYYVSASDFNSYKSSAHNEIARVDGRIDATNTNLANNYYDRTIIDKKFADFGGYKFRDADPDNNNQPILNDGEKPDPKAIYLTQPERETQYLQWIWDEEITEENKWKCIGDTTMDLSDYAKTVDVVASAEANKDWAERTFETQTEFSAVIEGYYTKGKVDTKLATKVDNTYKTEVEHDFVDTSAWANATFATKTDLYNDKSELEGEINNLESKIEQDINNASADIINKIDTTSAYLDDKIEAVIDTLEDDYYTSEQIDTILAASGEYYTKTESDTKYAEKEVFNTAINELSSNKLDKSATANWDVTEYTEGENIKIVGHKISGKDWSNEIADAVENKVDESELENYVTKTEFNDLDTLSGKTVTVIKDSETVKAIPSTEPDGTISYTLSAHDGKQADYLWKPTVNAAGDISWELALTGDTPATANIKGSNGDNGKTPELTSENYHIKWKYTDESIWNDLGDFRGASGADGKDGITPTITIDPNDDTWIINGIDTGIVASGAVGPAGKDGKDGVDGKDGQNGISLSATSQELTNKTQVQIGQVNGPVQTTFDLPWGQDGISPTVTTNTLLPDEHQAEGHINGGVKVTITDKTGDHEYTAWNGNNGTMAGAPTIMGYDGIVANLNGTQYEVGLSSEYKAAIESISADYLTITNAQNTYLTKADAQTNYQPKGNYANTADLQYVSAGVDYVSGAIPDTSDMATKTWVGGQGYLTQSDIVGKADKTDLQYVSAGVDYVSGQIPSLNGYATETWVENKHYLVANDIAGKADEVDLQYVSAGIDYVSGHIPTKVTDLTDSANYYTINQTSAASELTTEFAKYTKTEDLNIPTKVTDLTDAANYVVTGDILTGTGDKLTGIKIGSTSYTVPTTDLSNYYTKYQTSAASELDDEFAKYLKLVATEKGLTGTGTANDKIRIDETGMTNGNKYGWDYQNQQWAVINEGGGTTYIDNTYLSGDGSTQANAIGLKSGYAISISTATNEIKSIGNPTNAVSAMSYVGNSQHAGWEPQKSCICQESEIYAMSQLANGQGMLFFVVSAH